MSKPKKLKNGRWQIQVYLGRSPEGKTIVKTLTAATKREASARAAALLLEKGTPSRDTLRVAIAEYIAFKEPVLSPATVRGYRNIERELCRSYSSFVDKKLHVIDGESLQLFLNELSLGKSQKTVRNYYGLISASLHYKKIQMEPCTLPRKTRTEITVPTAEVAEKVFSAVRGTDLEVPMILAASGLRRGEICALSPADFSGDVVHVSKDMVYSPAGKWVTKPPKTFSSDRYVELPPGVGDLVRQRGYVCRYNPSRLTEAHGRLIKSLGLPHIRLHDWRHFMVSRLHDQGCSDAFIQKYGGWSSDRTMKSVYRHTLADRDAEMAKVATSSLADLLPK